MHDRLATARRIRVLTVVDTFTRHARPIEPRFGYRAGDVIDGLGASDVSTDLRRSSVSAKGSGFVSRALDFWAYQRDVTVHVFRRGKPTENAVIESLNGTFRTAA